jgi:hypothetical protein
MMKQLNAIIALVMALSVPAVQANAATNSVESAVQELNFQLTVATKPSDTAARKQAVNKFLGQIADLQKSGVSNDQILSEVKKQLPDAQTAKELETIATTAKQNKLSQEQTNQLVVSYLNKAKTNGASWSDGATIGLVAAAVVAIVVVVLLTGGSVSVQSTTTTYDSCYYQCYDYYYNYYYCC